MRTKIKELKKNKIFNLFIKYFVLTAANLILALVVTVFLEPINIVSGGLTGIGLIIQNSIEHWTQAPAADWVLPVILYSGEAILLVISFIFLGKSVTLKSLYSCIAFPTIVAILKLCGIDSLVNSLYEFSTAADAVNVVKEPGLIVMGAVLGGVGTGLAVAFSFSVGGSTGGIDTIVLIILKYTKRIKESTICFLVDATIIVAGIVQMLIWKNAEAAIGQREIILMMMNVISAFIGSAVVDFMYLKRNSSVVVSVISPKVDEINEFIQKELDRGSTIYDVRGGYTGDAKKELKTVIARSEYETMLEGIQSIDPSAFITFTVTKEVMGQGFSIDKYRN